MNPRKSNLCKSINLIRPLKSHPSYLNSPQLPHTLTHCSRSLNFILDYSLPHSLLKATVSDTRAMSLCNLLFSSHRSLQPPRQAVWHTHTHWLNRIHVWSVAESCWQTINPFIRQLEQITTHVDGVWVWTAGGHRLTRNRPTAVTHNEDPASQKNTILGLLRLYPLTHHTGPWCEWKVQ